MSKKYQSYTEEFKLSVIREYLSSNMSMYACAKKFGISNRSSLSRWLRQYGYGRKTKNADSNMDRRSEESYRNEIAQLKKRICELEKALELSLSGN